MSERAAKIRLFVDAPLAAGGVAALDDKQARYVFSVMRAAPGDMIRVFNGQDGEWHAAAIPEGRRGGHIRCETRLREQAGAMGPALLFAPVKRAGTDLIVEKATELGVSALRPVLTRRTNASHVRADRMRAIAIEAAEQCERLSLPEIHAPVSLDAALGRVDGSGDDTGDGTGDGPVMFCDERLAVSDPVAALRARGSGDWSILIGPEGGFDAAEAERLRAHPRIAPVSLGPRILRAETAAIAALTLWQAALGDWRTAPEPRADQGGETGCS